MFCLSMLHTQLQMLKWSPFFSLFLQCWFSVSRSERKLWMQHCRRGECNTCYTGESVIYEVVKIVTGYVANCLCWLTVVAAHALADLYRYSALCPSFSRLLPNRGLWPAAPKTMFWSPTFVAAAPNTSHVGLLNSRLLPLWAPWKFS